MSLTGYNNTRKTLQPRKRHFSDPKGLPCQDHDLNEERRLTAYEASGDKADDGPKLAGCGPKEISKRLLTLS